MVEFTSIPNPIQVRHLSTGVDGLDELLGGGLLEGRTVLLKGTPGSGKTTLGLQMLIAGALEHDQPGILLTFEQMPTQLAHDVASFGWNLDALTRNKDLFVNFIRPEDILEQPGRQENRLLANIADWIDDYGPRRILIDSLSHLRPLLAGDNARPLLLKFLMELKKLGLTPILTAELTTGEGLAGLDAYLVDTVIHLHHECGGPGRPERRALEIIKTRGQRHVGGAHPLEISAHGLIVYPHLYLQEEHAEIEPVPDLPAVEAPEAAPPSPDAHRPLPTGVEGLDPLLSGGYLPGSVIMVAGLSGTFKTTLAAQFLARGGRPAGAGEAPQKVGKGARGLNRNAAVESAGPGRGLWLAFQESGAALADILSRQGEALQPETCAWRCIHYDPGRQPLEKILRQAEQAIRAEGVTRVVIDSLNDLVAGLADETQRQEAVTWFLHRLRAQGVTTLCTQRLARVTGRNPLSEILWAELADTIVYLGLVEIDSRLEKVISVLKHRGGQAEGDLRSIDYTAHGLRVSERFVGLSGVLAGTPLGRRKTQIEEIFQPLYFIRDFLALARDPGLDGERRDEILVNLNTETAQLIDLLGRYFDQPAAHRPTGPEKSS